MIRWMLLVSSLALAACNRGQTASAQQLGRDASMLNVRGDAGRLTGIGDGGTFRLSPLPQQLPTSQTNPFQPPGGNPYAPGQTNPPVPR